MKNFCQSYGLKNLINEPTCYKNTNNPSSIDVILTNRPNSFQNSMAIETGLSDHHKIGLNSTQNVHKKDRSLPLLNTVITNILMITSLVMILIYNLQKFDKTAMRYEDFKDIFMSVLDRHAVIKEKRVRGNNAPFMNKNPYPKLLCTGQD